MFPVHFQFKDNMLPEKKMMIGLIFNNQVLISFWSNIDLHTFICSLLYVYVMWTEPSLASMTAGYENSFPDSSSKVITSSHESPSSMDRPTLRTPLDTVL